MMLGTLLKETKKIQVATEKEAIELINEFRDAALNDAFTVTKGTYVMKTRKSKGEIVDSWYIVTVELSYDE